MNRIEIEIRTIREVDYLVIDGHILYDCSSSVKAQEILDYLELMGYISIKVSEDV